MTGWSRCAQVRRELMGAAAAVVQWAAFRRVAFALLLVGLFAGTASPAHAWKPNTHLYAGNQAIKSILQGNNFVVIDGQSYNVDPRAAQAIRNWPAY